MKKMLNNPIVIAILIVGAIFVLYINVVKPIMGDGNLANTNLDDVIAPMEGEIGMENSASNNMAETTISFTDKISITEIPKNRQSKRDPFRFTAKIKNLFDDSGEALSEIIMKKPKLNAVIASKGLSFAVIGGEIVSVGDKVGDYIITEIAANQVTVEGSTETLTLEVEAFPQNSGETHE